MESKPYTWRYITEAPTGEGDNFNAPIDKSAINTADYKDHYLTKKIPSEEDRKEKVAEIIVKVKEFLLNQPNKVFLKDYEFFRDEIVKIMQQVIPTLDASNAKYGSRTIQKYLNDTGIIKDERHGFSIVKPIKTVEAVKVLTPKLEPVLQQNTPEDGDLPPGDDRDDDEYNEVNSNNFIKPSFETNIRYEKYGEDFDESSLSEEESEALDLISDNDTGSAIIQKLQTKRSFKGKSISEIYDIINSLIQKNAILPAKGFNFSVGTDDLPAYSDFKRQNKTLGESHISKYTENELMLEAYLNRSIVKEGALSNIGNKIVSKLPLGNISAQARGNVNAYEQQRNAYHSFLQTLGQAGYNNRTVPGNFLLGWFKQNIDSDVETYDEAKNINNTNRLIDPQKTFNQLMQAHNRHQISTNQNNQPAPTPAPNSTPPILGTQPPKSTKKQIGQGYGLKQADYNELLANITNAKDARAKTRAINSFLRKHNFDIKQP